MKAMLKKTLCALIALAAMMSTCAMLALAAPSEMADVPASNGMLYIDIYNPETVVSTTTQSDYVLSGVARSGVVVSVYYLERSTGTYKMVWADNSPAVQTIGASGYFAQRIFLTEGRNDILVRVDSSESDEIAAQIVSLEINLLVDSFWDRFRSTSQNMENELRDAFR